MFWKTEVEAVTADKTHIYLRNSDAEGEYWQVTVLSDPNNFWYTVLHDGWVVYEMKHRRADNALFTTWRAREPIPDAVMSHLPTKGKRHLEIVRVP